MVELTFGAQLRRCRQMASRGGKQLTQEQLAQEAGIHPSQVSRYEHDHAAPSPETFGRLVDLLLFYRAPQEEVEQLRKLAQERAVQVPTRAPFAHTVAALVDMALEDPNLADEQRVHFGERIREFVTRWRDLYRAQSYLRQPDRSERRALAEELLKELVATEERDPLSPRPAAIETLAWLARQTGQLTSATAYYERLLLDYPNIEEKNPDAKFSLGDTYRRLGRFALARVIYSQEPRGLGTEASQLWQAVSLRKQASTYLYQGRFALAEELLKKSLEIIVVLERNTHLATELRTAVSEARGSLHHQLEWAHYALGDEEGALDHNTRAAEIWGLLPGYSDDARRYRQTRAKVYRGEILLKFGRHREAQDCLRQASSEGEGLGAEAFIIGDTSLGLGIALLEDGQPLPALRHLRVALDTFEGMGDTIRRARAYSWLGRLQARTEDYDRAERLLKLAAGIFEEAEAYYNWAACLLDLCDLYCWFGARRDHQWWEESASQAKKLIEDYEFLDHKARLHMVNAEERLSDASSLDEALNAYREALACALQFHDCMVVELLRKMDAHYEGIRNRDRHAAAVAYAALLEFLNKRSEHQRFRLQIGSLQRRIETDTQTGRLDFVSGVGPR